MAAWTIRPIAPSRWNESNQYKSYPLKAAQDFAKGAPVLLNAAGEIEEAGADPALVLGFATAGAADYSWMADTFGYAEPRVPVALSDQEFRGTLEGTLDIDADISDQFGLVKDASGYWTVDRSDTTNVVVTVIGYEDGVADGDTNPPVIFRVIDTVRQADS